MATVVNFDFSGFDRTIKGMVSALQQTEAWLRPAVVELAGAMHNRIHNLGLDSEGRPLGQYSSGYLRQRQRNKLGSDSKVVLVYTRKLSNSWAAIPTPKGWGVGFTDEGTTEGVTALKKIRYNEVRLRRKISDLTPEESARITARITAIVAQILNQNANRT